MRVDISFQKAKSQLIEAIHLFFEERDPVSVHTLSGASLEILNDHITDKGIVWDNNLIFHYEAIYIKEECRKEWQAKVREAKFFFKHADRDLKKGKIEIEFDPETNEFYILEAIKTLGAVIKEEHFWPAEFKIFLAWIICKYPQIFEDRAVAEQLIRAALETKADYKKAIDFMNKYPERFNPISK